MEDNEFKKQFQKQIERRGMMLQWADSFMKQNIAPIMVVGVDTTGQWCIEIPPDFPPKMLVEGLRECATNIERGSAIKLIQ